MGTPWRHRRFRSPPTGPPKRPSRILDLLRPGDGAAVGPVTKARSSLHRSVGLLFHRMLAMPMSGNPEWAYQRAVELSHDTTYQTARRALFDWEDERVHEEWPTKAAVKELQELVIMHDELVERAFRTTRKRQFYRVAKHVVSAGAELVGSLYNIPLTGAGSGAAIEFIEAKFPGLDKRASDPNESPGAALSTAISVMTHR